jgi:uncharacterized protein
LTIGYNLREIINATIYSRVMRLLTLSVLLIVWAALSPVAVGPAAAGPLADAEAAFNKGDYETAARLLRPLADHGDPFPQTMLGGMYEMGDGVRQNYATAATWYRKAAEQGFAVAQVSLARLYEQGRGVPQDYVQAFKWYVLAIGGYDMPAANTAAEAKKARDDLAAKMTQAQIDEGAKQIREWAREWRAKNGRGN